MRKPTFSEIRYSYKKMGYTFYEKGVYNLNIFGIRSRSSQSDQFDDLIGVAFYDLNRVPRLYLFKATTDPGKYWLLNPFTKRGTAIVAAGQTSGAYKIGYHGRNGKYPYEALEQVKPIPFVRDYNKDTKLDFELYRDPLLRSKHLIDDKIIKTNLHRASKWKVLQWIGRYSAGCQVIQNPKSFNKLMSIVKLAVHRFKWKNSFTYTLFEEDEIQYKA